MPEIIVSYILCLFFNYRDGRLAEGDQILAIDGQPLDAAITHQQAIGILQQARGEVEIIVARAPDLLYPLEPLVPGKKSS
jgi:hypothetical protein